jgi:hypothetical protein
MRYDDDGRPVPHSAKKRRRPGDIVRDGQGVRVPLMLLDGQSVNSAGEVHWATPIRDSSDFDVSALHRPGYRTSALIDSMPRRDARSDPAAAARAERIVRQANQWRDYSMQPGVPASSVLTLPQAEVPKGPSGGQVNRGETHLRGEVERSNETRGGVYGSIADKARADKIARLNNAWRGGDALQISANEAGGGQAWNSGRQLLLVNPAVGVLQPTLTVQTDPDGDEEEQTATDARDQAYEAKKSRLESAYKDPIGGGFSGLGRWS